MAGGASAAAVDKVNHQAHTLEGESGRTAGVTPHRRPIRPAAGRRRWTTRRASPERTLTVRRGRGRGRDRGTRCPTGGAGERYDRWSSGVRGRMTGARRARKTARRCRRTPRGAGGARLRGTFRRRGFVVVTGLSGAGKSAAIRALEDLGYLCVDNLPTVLIPTSWPTSIPARANAARRHRRRRRRPGPVVSSTGSPASSRRFAPGAGCGPGSSSSRPPTPPCCGASARPAGRIRWPPPGR